jgi:hypothetical protein
VPGLIATLALAFFVVSAALVAVTVALVPLVTLGAVNMPPLETAPEVADHVTAVLLVPCTTAVNCWLLPDVKAAALGETVTLMLDSEAFTVTLACALFVVSAELVAVTVTVVALDTVGAMK